METVLNAQVDVLNALLIRLAQFVRTEINLLIINVSRDVLMANIYSIEPAKTVTLDALNVIVNHAFNAVINLLITKESVLHHAQINTLTIVEFVMNATAHAQLVQTN